MASPRRIVMIRVGVVPYAWLLGSLAMLGLSTTASGACCIGRQGSSARGCLSTHRFKRILCGGVSKLIFLLKQVYLDAKLRGHFVLLRSFWHCHGSLSTIHTALLLGSAFYGSVSAFCVQYVHYAPADAIECVWLYPAFTCRRPALLTSIDCGPPDLRLTVDDLAWCVYVCKCYKRACLGHGCYAGYELKFVGLNPFAICAGALVLIFRRNSSCILCRKRMHA